MQPSQEKRACQQVACKKELKKLTEEQVLSIWRNPATARCNDWVLFDPNYTFVGSAIVSPDFEANIYQHRQSGDLIAETVALEIFA